MTQNTKNTKQGLVLLGSTGSIGESTLSVVDNLGPDRIEIVGLAGGRQVEKLAKQARQYKAQFVSCLPGEPFNKLKRELAGENIEVLSGAEGQKAMVANENCDTVLAAITGAAGLPAVIEAVTNGRRLCISNKESLVVAGPIVRALAAKHGAELLPVDSEHSALFQALQSGKNSEVRRMILTASGGPFREWSTEAMKNATIEQALKHPTWKMGPNITIDSATLMNKSLELIEAQYLFDMPTEKIEVIVHPQSVVHSFVEFVDGSVMAQLGVPDMRVPIQYALTFPDRAPLSTAPFNLAEIASLTFEDVDRERFPVVDLAYRVMRAGGAAGAVFNAANEISRGSFLEGKIGFSNIVETTRRVLDRFFEGPWPGSDNALPDLETLLRADVWAREEATRCLHLTV
ncbi:MAG: 1-deoxy-D-xylulose-5-phosphate reductoisomerase [Planctomycetota bacterium]|nr:1-deoxy-D-xylulose-5-phosphate reductoisomerase [Planctomycetota bacterium]